MFVHPKHDTGRESFTRPANIRRKVVVLTEEGVTPASSFSTTGLPFRTVMSSEKRRHGTKYSDSEKTASQNDYQILYSRPSLKPAVSDYDYYEDQEQRFVGEGGKIVITSRGLIKCLDQGNFAHPKSCRKFISCAKMGVNGVIIGTEYECPKKLSFDPIGGMCNWSAGLGCHE